MITVNGNKEQYPGPVTVARYLEGKGFRTDRIAVERNGQILAKALYADTSLSDGDCIEIVSFVGGG